MEEFGYDTKTVQMPSAVMPSTSVCAGSLRQSSGFECSLTAYIHGIEQYSTVPSSRVTDRLHRDFSKSTLSASSVFGDGIVLSDADGRVIVNALSSTEKQVRDAAVVLLNGTLAIDIHLTIQGMDSHFFVKPPGKQAAEDLWKLSLSGDWLSLGNGMNITVHKPDSVNSKDSNIDVRLQGPQSVINIRYGTTVERETNRVKNYAKEWAVSQAWVREQNLLRSGHYGSYHWTEAEKRDILERGSVASYNGHYLRDVATYPELADDCNNIVFRKKPPLDNMIQVY